jgi:predicted GTPase
LVADYLPGSHMLTVDHWRTLAKAPGWLKTARDVYWAISIILQPAHLTRYAARRLTVDPTMRHLRENALAWFYVMFIRQVGYYVIEMNSGRLRGGADRYRQIAQEPPSRSTHDTADSARPERHGVAPAGKPAEVIIALVGQVNAGKSSLANALLGEQKAAVDVLPETKNVSRYRLDLPETNEHFLLLDTGGYGDDKAKAVQFDETRAAAKGADVILLVMNAANPSRQTDLKLVQELVQWFEMQPHLKLPPVLGVLTHIDNLSPVMEWSPPYDWQAPSTQKERSILAAVEYHRAEFGDLIAGVIPVCTDAQNQRAYGVDAWLLPAIVSLLGEARSHALLRTLHADLDSDQLRKVIRQLGNVGMHLLKTCIRHNATEAGRPR